MSDTTHAGTIEDVVEPTYDVLPANEVSWEELAGVFGTRGPAARCFCQRYKLASGESFGSCPPQVRAARLREQTGAGAAPSNGRDPGATSGLVAYLDGEPVGWCAAEPRPVYGGLVRNGSQTAWRGREQDRTDEGIWAVTCVLVRTGYRRRGVSRALVRGAVAHARDRGARALEGYPLTSTATALAEELHVGQLSTFLAAGFTDLSRPSARRAVVRVDL